MKSLVLALIALSAGSNGAQAPLPAPLVDYHQHLVSPAFAKIAKVPELDGKDITKLLDAAGISQAVVLSTAYSFADERKALPQPDALTTAENLWTAKQVASARGRLVGFCSANPLRPAALSELQHCLGLPGMVGIKLHFGNSGVTVRNPAQRERMAAVFRLANRFHAPVLVHFRSRGGENYGALDARLFLDHLLPLARSTDVIVGHLAGSGPGFDPAADEVMGEFAAAFHRHDPRVRRLYFDVATIVSRDSTSAENAKVAARIRQVGARHVLFGSDLAAPGRPDPAESWALFRAKSQLTKPELRLIARHRLAFLPSPSRFRIRWPKAFL